MFPYFLIKLVLQRKILLTKGLFLQKQKSIVHVQDFAGQIGFIGFFCNAAHLFHQKNAERRGYRNYFL